MAVGGAAAISLGQSRGSVILGAPVDLAFDVQPDAGSDIAASCITADVAFGDAPVGDARVRVSPLPVMPGRSPSVRVQVVGSVNEPVITVTLSAGCSGKVTRTYTFLADLPVAHVPGRVVNIDQLASVPAAGARGSEAGVDRPVSPSAVRRRVVQAPADPLEQREAAASVPIKPQTARPTARMAPPRAPREVVRKAPEREERTAKVTTPPPPTVRERSRLVMEPLDALAEPSLGLRPSADMGAVPAQASASQRQEAAAAWKAMNAPLDGVPQDDERVRALEAEMAAMRAKSTAERASMAELQQRLALIEDQRFSSGLVYALMAALALALGVLAWVWTRARRDSLLAIQAWRDSVALSARHTDAGRHDAHDPHGLTPHPHDTWVPEDSSPFGDDTYLLHSETPTFHATVVPAASTPERTPQPVSVPETGPRLETPSQIVNPEELFDIQQQAEFFVSVGEHDQAVDVLKKHIAAHQQTSPSAYRELLRLYHKLGRADDFAQLREQFCRHFNAQVPEFPAFSNKGRALEDYIDELAAIEAVWTSSSVLQLLEKFLFLKDGRATVAPFDLAAFDDLLLLRAIAQSTPASARGAPPPRMRTTPLALPFDRPGVSAPAGRKPVASAVAAVDLPLDSLAASLEFDFGQHVPSAGDPGNVASQASARPDSPRLELELDLDLSDPPHLTLSDLPPAPVTAPPPPGQPIGFGIANDLVEARLELDQPKTEPKA
ncbi:hypothetical protein CBP36_11385 [Acidovorax carolinensis]|uniref:Uncharacterized protein n=1 Tax=Acidovorax carolinensis TaxID=553814 RepID=A0A240UE63_9BURK|nr:hypothetical protein [Acidovorax carolinensis]ART54912.1 hypothetical protein CBP35_07545 [Acidovorax carolinensis]ART59363.1 hypothetical protein CBP36_11385 [Acidovorax carolinensis]